MRAAAAALLLTLAACEAMMRPEHEYRAHMSKEELEAGPTYHQMMGAILYDVRVWRELDKKLEEGKTACAGIVEENGLRYCAKCQEQLQVYIFPDKTKEQLHRVEESAYYCSKEGFYFYHYVGGRNGLNVWMGPYPLKREARKLEE
jgi:hypothetical protein